MDRHTTFLHWRLSIIKKSILHKMILKTIKHVFNTIPVEISTNCFQRYWQGNYKCIWKGTDPENLKQIWKRRWSVNVIPFSTSDAEANGKW